MTGMRTSIAIHPSVSGLRWPGGRYAEIAMIDIDENEVIAKLGRPLFTGVEEGLGPWKADGFFLSTGEMMELILYLPMAKEGFILRADYGRPVELSRTSFRLLRSQPVACVGVLIKTRSTRTSAHGDAT
jgi:hypothetical protein